MKRQNWNMDVRVGKHKSWSQLLQVIVESLKIGKILEK